DFLGDGLRTSRRGQFGDWSKEIGGRWTRVARRIPVPPDTRDALMSVGLLGATGVLEIDGISFELVPIGGSETGNLVANAHFELGSPDPDGGVVSGGAHRAHPGSNSASALELRASGARAMVGLAMPVEPFPALDLNVMVKAQALRGAGGAAATLF